MADVKISQLPASTTPLDGTEVLPIVQSATTKQVSIANLTAGRAMSASSLTLSTPLAVTSGGTGLNTTGAGTFIVSGSVNTISATATPTLGVQQTTQGTLTLANTAAGAWPVTIQSSNSATAAWTMTLPPAVAAGNGYILTSTTGGVTSWTNPTALGVDLDVGTTAITGGTSGRVLYNNAGVLGEYAVTGTGSVVLGTSPTFTTSLTSPLVIGGTTASSSLTLQSTSGVGTSDSILFKVGNNGATTAATIDSAGNLGLGVTPGVRLDVSSGSVSLATNFNSTNASGVYIRFTNSGTAIGDIGSGANLVSGGTAGDFGLTSRSGNLILGSSSTERARIDSSGNLLVGTTANNGVITSFVNSATGRAGFFMNTQASSLAYDALGVSKYDNDTTTSQVFVKFFINNNATGSGLITANGANAATFTSSSDARLKENITPLPYQLKNICKLKPSEFDYKDGTGHQIGFIAQDMEQVYPDCVAEDAEGMLMISGWSKTEARLVKAIQELAVKVAELEAKI
jgi:hypothetical protein